MAKLMRINSERKPTTSFRKSFVMPRLAILCIFQHPCNVSMLGQTLLPESCLTPATVTCSVQVSCLRSLSTTFFFLGTSILPQSLWSILFPSQSSFRRRPGCEQGNCTYNPSGLVAAGGAEIRDSAQHCNAQSAALNVNCARVENFHLGVSDNYVFSEAQVY